MDNGKQSHFSNKITLTKPFKIKKLSYFIIKISAIIIIGLNINDKDLIISKEI